MEKYEDIIKYSRPKSKYPKMSLYQRSAQFAPFSALTGYEEKIKEVEKINKNERYYTRIDEMLKQFATWQPEYEKE